MLNGNCTELHAVDSTRAAVPSFVFIFNQDYFFLFSYQFASCKQVHKDPSFGEIRVRMNISRRGDASILRCFGANSFRSSQSLAMP